MANTTPSTTINNTTINNTANTTNQASIDAAKQLKSSVDSIGKLEVISGNTADQLLALKDILDVLKNIADNVVAGLRAAGTVYAVQPKANRLEKVEKEREANKAQPGIPGKDSPFASLKGIFDSISKGFKVISLLLIPLLLGFLIGFRKKFDLLTIALGIAIYHPIRTFKLIIKVFKGLFNLVASVGVWRKQLSIGFKILTNAWNKSFITKISNGFLSSIQGFFSSIKGFFSRMASRFTNVTGITKQLDKVSKFFSNVKILFNSMTAPMGDVKRAKDSLGKFGKMIQEIGVSFNRARMGLNPSVNKFMAAINGAKNFFLGIGQKISGIFSKVMTAIKPVTDFIKAIFEPITKLFRAGSGAAGLMNNPAMKFLFKIAGKGLRAVPILGQIIMIVEGLMGFVKGGIKGYKEGGIVGAIKGALSGLIDGLFGWIWDLVGWVLGALGFEDAEKALVEDLGVFERISDLFSGKVGFLESIGLFIDSMLAFPKFLLEALFGILGFDAIATYLADFSFVDLFEQLWLAIKDWVLDAPKRLLGGWFGDDDDDEKDEKAANKAKLAKSTDPAIENTKGVVTPTTTSPQQANQNKLNETTEKNKNLAAAPKQPPAISSSTNVAVDNSQKQAVTYRKELHAGKNRGAPDVRSVSPF